MSDVCYVEDGILHLCDNAQHMEDIGVMHTCTYADGRKRVSLSGWTIPYCPFCGTPLYLLLNPEKPVRKSVHISTLYHDADRACC